MNFASFLPALFFDAPVDQVVTNFPHALLGYDKLMAPFEWLLLTAIILFVGVFIEALVAGAFLRRSLGLRGWALVLGANVASFTLVLLSEVVGQRYFF